MMLSANPYQYGQMGPGGGSVPAWVMRSGQFAPFSALNPRRDIEPQWVQDATQIPVGQPGPAAPSQTVGPGTMMPMPAPTAGFGDFGEFGAASPTAYYVASAVSGVILGSVTGAIVGVNRMKGAGVGALVGAVGGLALKFVGDKILARM